MPPRKTPATYPVRSLGTREVLVEPCRGPLCMIGNRVVLANRGKGITLPSKRVLKAIIVKPSETCLTEGAFTSAKNVVSTKLNEVHKFDVTLQNNVFSAIQARKLLDSDLVAYLVKKLTSIDEIHKLAIRHLHNSDSDGIKQLVKNNWPNAGGLNIREWNGERSVSFVKLGPLERRFDGPGAPKTGAAKSALAVKFGKMIGWLTAHEFGHALGAKHPPKYSNAIMDPTTVTDIDAKVPSYIAKSKKLMYATLNKVCGCRECISQRKSQRKSQRRSRRRR